MLIKIDYPNTEKEELKPNDFIVFNHNLCKIMTLYPSHYLADLYRLYDGTIISRCSYADIEKVPEGTVITITV